MAGLVVESGKVYRDLNLVGDGTGVGITLKGANNAVLENVTVSNFETGVQFLDDCYGNNCRNVIATGCTTGFALTPSEPIHCNENYFFGCQAAGNKGDGLVLDGAQGNFFFGFHAESNSGYGINLAPTKSTTHNSFFGLWLEHNKADIRFGAPPRVWATKFVGGILVSQLPISGIGWLGWGNTFDVEGGLIQALCISGWWGLRKLLGISITD